ncbi:hypothetical protein J6590_099232, partial [Homalodisca vitripennis]
YGTRIVVFGDDSRFQESSLKQCQIPDAAHSERWPRSKLNGRFQTFPQSYGARIVVFGDDSRFQESSLKHCQIPDPAHSERWPRAKLNITFLNLPTTATALVSLYSEMTPDFRSQA